jgi:hypothetical protein
MECQFSFKEFDLAQLADGCRLSALCQRRHHESLQLDASLKAIGTPFYVVTPQAMRAPPPPRGAG